MTGQINLEFKQPDDEQFHFNFYENQSLRTEVNMIKKFELSKKWCSSILAHYENRPLWIDNNSDGFSDLLTGQDASGLIRFNYEGQKVESKIVFSGIYSDKLGGQNSDLDNPYLIGLNENRLSVSAKTGIIFDRKSTSLGLISNAYSHNRDYSFGTRDLTGGYNAFYFNSIYQTFLLNTNNTIKLGVSTMIDGYSDQYTAGALSIDVTRTEIVSGAFAEYSLSRTDVYDFVLGVRGDYHNHFGLFASPRLHFKYFFEDKSVVRIAAGQGRRTANVFAENFSYLISSRDLEVPNSTDPYLGLEQEVATNLGVAITKKFKKGDVSAEYYRTDFQNQIVIDIESVDAVSFYNLDGKSYSNSFMLEMNFELIENWDVRLAYRLFDVQTTYSGLEKERPLISKHRWLFNTAYEIDDKWKFDLTYQLHGAKRMVSNTGSNVSQVVINEDSPVYSLINLQVTKMMGERFDLYVGVENLLNYKQNVAILNADSPFDDGFDTSQVWGPVFGRMVYLGLRYVIDGGEEHGVQ